MFESVPFVTLSNKHVVQYVSRLVDSVKGYGPSLPYTARLSLHVCSLPLCLSLAVIFFCELSEEDGCKS
jgi:hypothetical protein